MAWNKKDLNEMIAYVQLCIDTHVYNKKLLDHLELYFRKHKEQFRKYEGATFVMEYKDFPYISAEASADLFTQTKKFHQLWWCSTAGNLKYSISDEFYKKNCFASSIASRNFEIPETLFRYFCKNLIKYLKSIRDKDKAKQEIKGFMSRYDEYIDEQDPLCRYGYTTPNQFKKYINTIPEGHAGHGDISLKSMEKRKNFQNEKILRSLTIEAMELDRNQLFDYVLDLHRKIAVYYDYMPMIRRHHVEVLHALCKERHSDPCDETRRLYNVYDLLPFRSEFLK